ncbi:MAG: helix-hairpin-helix domain-containing protein [Actinomycetota bacterium]|nr:helix-hairpin-helix domain-containing protein [Actinomycetota bacterium]
MDRLTDLLDRLADLPRWQLAVMALCAAALVAGGYVLLRPHSRTSAEFISAEGGGEELSSEAREVVVYVAGEVASPGVVRLREGSRVVDALEQAGGPTPDADLEALNLAQPLQDGQKIQVPRAGEGAGAPGGGGSGKVNINLAGRQELEKLPGIGPTLAERIIAYRESKGGFSSVEELKKVSGIGEKKFAEIRDLVEV